MRVSQLIARAAGELGSAAEARTLLAHVLDIEPAALLLAPDPDADALAAFDALVARRVAGEPVQYLTGRAHFRTVSLAVGPGVFVPRPETEVMTGWVLDRLAELERPGRIVELCAGSGAISLAIATEAPGHEQWAIELSDIAFDHLVRNLAGTGVTPPTATWWTPGPNWTAPSTWSSSIRPIFR